MKQAIISFYCCIFLCHGTNLQHFARAATEHRILPSHKSTCDPVEFNDVFVPLSLSSYILHHSNYTADTEEQYAPVLHSYLHNLLFAMKVRHRSADRAPHYEVCACPFTDRNREQDSLTVQNIHRQEETDSTKSKNQNIESVREKVVCLFNRDSIAPYGIKYKTTE